MSENAELAAYLVERTNPGHHSFMSDGGKVGIQPANAGQRYLNEAELHAALDALSVGDKLKLFAAERALRSGTGFSEKELFQEAYCRVFLGERHCPHNVPLIAFLIMSMKSIASHEREKRKARQRDETEDLIEDSALSPEEQLIAHEKEITCEDIFGHFDDDEEAQLVLLGWSDDLRGKALREATGLDQAGLDYAIKRIRRKMNKVYPNGGLL